MVRHIVLVQLKDDADKNLVIEKSREMLYALKEKLGYLYDISVTTGLKDLYSTHDMLIVSEFETERDLRRFQEDPEHAPSSLYIKSKTKHRACVDCLF